MRGFILGIVFTLCFPLLLSAQEPERFQGDRYEEMAAMRRGSRLYYDAFALPGDSAGTLLTVEFRIPNDRLVFMRHTEGVHDELFRASVSVTVEVYQDGKIMTEKTWRSESTAPSYKETVDPMRSTVGSMSFLVPAGHYGVRLQLNDLNTDRTLSTPIRPVKVSAFDSVEVGQAIIADTVVTDEPTRYLTLVNLGGDARFGRPAVAIVPIALDSTQSPENASIKWVLRKLDSQSVREEMRSRRRRMESHGRREEADDDELPKMEPPPTTEGGSPLDSGRVAFSSFLPLGTETTADIHLNRITLPEPGSTSRGFLAPIDLHGANLENGAYVLDVTLEGESKPVRSSTRFSTHWPDMPTSLLDIDVAIKNLRFIVDKSVVDQIKDGSREDKIKKFNAFWKKRDPTPETAYNELMVEYYRRIDFAALEYRTGPGMIPNGLETDRARIYIVNGPPDHISRTFPEEGGVLETWTYSDGKTFTFEAASSIDPFHIVKEG